MVVRTKVFDFVTFSRTLESNLWDLAWSTDIIMGFLCFFASTLYFKNRILSFSIFLVTMFFDVNIVIYDVGFDKPNSIYIPNTMTQ